MDQNAALPLPLPLPPEPGVPQLWMIAPDVFHLPGQGTVVAGLLEGFGLLSPGDFLVCDGQRWPVRRIEQKAGVLTGAEPGADIGVLLKPGPTADVLRGKRVEFVAGRAGRPPGPAGLAGRLRRRRG